jgi:hypothetical protein
MLVPFDASRPSVSGSRAVIGIEVPTVMPALVAGIHVFITAQMKTWMASELGLARVPQYSLPQVG